MLATSRSLSSIETVTPIAPTDTWGLYLAARGEPAPALLGPGRVWLRVEATMDATPPTRSWPMRVRIVFAVEPLLTVEGAVRGQWPT